MKNIKKIYKVVFIIRKINDMDHMLPLICKFYDTGSFVRVITLNTNKINNYLSNYMFSKTGLLVETPVLDNMSKFFRFLIFTLDKFKNILMNNNLHLPLKYFEQVDLYIKKYILKHEDLKHSACNMILDCDNTDVIVMDKTNILGNKIYRHITKYASINNIPIIRIIHGFDTIVLDKNTIDSSNILLPYMGDKVFDIYHSMKEIYQGSYDLNFNKTSGLKTKEISKEEIKTFLLGSMRFSKRWVDEYKEIQKFDTTEKLKVDFKKNTILVIISSVTYLYIDRIASLLNAIASKFDVNIVYKPHTRDEKIDVGIKKMLNKETKIIYSYNCTVALIDASDLVLLCGVSSIGMHSIVNSSPIIFAEYTCRYTTYYSRYMKEYTSMSEHDVLTKIEDVFNKKMDFNNNISERIIMEMINPNDSDDIIQDHFELVCDIAKGSR
jgi:hypothetical protein